MRVLTVVAVGTLVGLGLAYLAVERGAGLDTVEAGPWRSRARIGMTEVDPYARAVLARSGELPLGAAEGLAFTARGDSSGELLDSRCDYRITGSVPHARYWTLSLNSIRGDLVPNPSKRYGFTSTEILRSAGGGFEFVVSPQARAGNWLPSGSNGRFVLVLRLYDTEIDLRSAPPRATEMPQIEKLSCR